MKVNSTSCKLTHCYAHEFAKQHTTLTNVTKDLSRIKTSQEKVQCLLWLAEFKYSTEVQRMFRQTYCRHQPITKKKQPKIGIKGFNNG
jgi:hypothetical protein